MDSKNDVLQRAVSSDGLQGRANGNKQFASKDFDAWVRNIINSLSFSKILDICCGTGDQLVVYAQKGNLDRLVGVDLSETSLSIAGQRLNALLDRTEVNLLNVPMEMTFEEPLLSELTFDIVSCFYGLYYAGNVPDLLRNMMRRLNTDGHILIVGPYGDNNKSLFELLQVHFQLPELVLRSSCTFMENEVVPVLKESMDVRIETFVNYISYPDVDSLFNYWKASTFYNEKYHDLVLRDIKNHFENNSEFVVEKHIMATIAHLP